MPACTCMDACVDGQEVTCMHARMPEYLHACMPALQTLPYLDGSMATCLHACMPTRGYTDTCMAASRHA
eukprot:122356-Chlamydomonas_euryale.AAC.3